MAAPAPRFAPVLRPFPAAPGLAQGAATSVNAAKSPAGSPGTLARACAELWGAIHVGKIPKDDDEEIKLAIEANKWAEHNKQAGNAVRSREVFSKYMATRYYNKLLALLNACCLGEQQQKLTPAGFANKRKVAFEETYFNRDFAEFHDDNGIPTSKPVWVAGDLPEFQICDPDWAKFSVTINPCKGRSKSRGGKRSTRRSKKSKRSTRRRAY